MRAVVEAYVAAHAACDLEAVMALFAERAVVEDPADAAPIAGREAIREFYQETQRRQGRLRVQRLGPVIVCGRHAATHVSASAEAAGFEAEADVIYELTVDDDLRITSLRAFFER